MSRPHARWSCFFITRLDSTCLDSKTHNDTFVQKRRSFITLKHRQWTRFYSLQLPVKLDALLYIGVCYRILLSLPHIIGYIMGFHYSCHLSENYKSGPWIRARWLMAFGDQTTPEMCNPCAAESIDPIMLSKDMSRCQKWGSSRIQQQDPFEFVSCKQYSKCAIECGCPNFRSQRSWNSLREHDVSRDFMIALFFPEGSKFGRSEEEPRQ